jgi:hypothetical protein
MAAMLLAALALQADAEGKDKTGLKWVLPFKEARAKAEKDARLLMIKPIAFGTTPDGGW